MEPTTHYLDPSQRNKILSIMNSWDCRHNTDTDINQYPMMLQNYLLHIGYITYDVTDTDINWKWTEGALELLNQDQPVPEPRKQPEHIARYIRGSFGIDLQLDISETTNPQMITVTPTAIKEGISHKFGHYDLFIHATEIPGMYNLSARDRDQNEISVLCHVDDVDERNRALKHESENQEIKFWERVDSKTFLCERLGIAIRLSETLKVDGEEALRVILEKTNGQDSISETTLLALTSSEMHGSNFGFAQVRYILSEKDPVFNMRTQRHMFKAN